MAYVVVYTSCVRHLDGGSGYGPAIRTQGIPPLIASALSGLSGGASGNPLDNRQSAICWNYVYDRISGETYSILSRIAANQVDHTARSINLASHVALRLRERLSCGPACILQKPEYIFSSFDGNAREIPELNLNDTLVKPAICNYWNQVTGDAGWGGVAADAVRKKKPIYVIYTPDIDLLKLFAESIALLPPKDRWDATFSTLYSQMLIKYNCLLRGVLAGSPEAANLNSPNNTADFIDLTKPEKITEVSDYVQLARTGISIPNEKKSHTAGNAVASPVSSKPKPILILADPKEQQKWEDQLESSTPSGVLKLKTKKDGINVPHPKPTIPKIQGSTSYTTTGIYITLLFILQFLTIGVVTWNIITTSAAIKKIEDRLPSPATTQKAPESAQSITPKKNEEPSKGQKDDPLGESLKKVGNKAGLNTKPEEKDDKKNNKGASTTPPPVGNGNPTEQVADNGSDKNEDPAKSTFGNLNSVSTPGSEPTQTAAVQPQPSDPQQAHQNAIEAEATANKLAQTQQTGSPITGTPERPVHDDNLPDTLGEKSNEEAHKIKITVTSPFPNRYTLENMNLKLIRIFDKFDNYEPTNELIIKDGDNKKLEHSIMMMKKDGKEENCGKVVFNKEDKSFTINFPNIKEKLIKCYVFQCARKINTSGKQQYFYQYYNNTSFKENEDDFKTKYERREDFKLDEFEDLQLTWKSDTTGWCIKRTDNENDKSATIFKITK